MSKINIKLGEDNVSFVITEEEGDENPNDKVVFEALSKERLTNLENELKALKEALLTINNLEGSLKNLHINATRLNGRGIKEFAVADHNHDEKYAPILHRSEIETYGKGTGEDYGHVKLISSLDEYKKNITSNDHAISASLLEAILNDKEAQKENTV